MAHADREFINKGHEALFARFSAELEHADEEGLVEQFLEAESTIEQYPDAVAEGSTSLPGSQDLAFACAVLLVTTQTLEEGDIERLGRLNAPEVGKSMFAISRQITGMKARGIARLATWAKADVRALSWPPLGPSTDGDVLF